MGSMDVRPDLRSVLICLALAVPGLDVGPGFGQQGLDCLEGFRTGVEHTYERLRRVHGMWHQCVQGRVVVLGVLCTFLAWEIAKECLEGLSAHADVEPEDAWTVKL